jgi:pyruvate formate lyase activating enzyme
MESTSCPGCGKKVVERVGFSVMKENVRKGRCGFCGEAISGVWE